MVPGASVQCPACPAAGSGTGFHAAGVDEAAAAARGEVAIGHHRAGGTDGSGRGLGGIIVNPTKSEPLAYSADDRIIVIAKD